MSHDADDAERAEHHDDHADHHGAHATEDDHGGHGHGHESYREQSGETRTTAPMQAYTTGQAGVGAAILVVGVAIAYLLPFLV